MLSAQGRSIEALLKRSAPLTEVVQDMIRTREAAWPKIWCYQPPPQPDWAALKSLDFNADYARLTDWMHALLDEAPLPDDITGLFFGMLYPSSESPHKNVAIFTTGSRRAPVSGEEILREWTLDDHYSPENCIQQSEVLSAIYRLVTAAVLDGISEREKALEMCFQWTALVVAEWLCGPMRRRLLGGARVRRIFAGMDFFMGFNFGVLTPENTP
ncbi:MAG TPA: hypothetical protein PLU30_06915 [Verrucomicrobiae bacterium]|nr:hypothetical protein [Verrucomicrobiae bacterium]